ncbi:MAG: hypothetical protein KDJ20_09275 [Hyphomicrobiales bacterium]|nr:hypothetical protein [Hyphomicrobiales bacterium]MCC2106661.1 hypothetical protein [Hyphomicrobiales bacterium]
MATMIIPSKAYGARAKRARPRSLLTRIFDAMKAARQQEADEIAARYMAGRWTDSVEREINDKLIHSEMHRLI